MKLVSYLNQSSEEQVAVLIEGRLYNLSDADSRLPQTIMPLLENWDHLFPIAKEAAERITSGALSLSGVAFEEATVLAPVPRPTSCRDAYAFRQHVAAARRNRKVEMIPEFDQFPIFYFTNHNDIQGPGSVVCMPDHFKKLDFELEIAVVLGKRGRNIDAKDADQYIAGFCIMNDMSARTLQMEEMRLNLGPAKGKDFSTVIGPWLVTPDELASLKVAGKEGHDGTVYDLKMTCSVNGKQVSEGNFKDMDWTFAEIIERCSYGTDVLPGDVIGSGTVGTGCFLELNGTGKLHHPDYQEQWLQPDDEVVMTIEGLGTLTNKIVADPSHLSLLAKKKNL